MFHLHFKAQPFYKENLPLTLKDFCILPAVNVEVRISGESQNKQ
jgi:hypothetical protein